MSVIYAKHSNKYELLNNQQALSGRNISVEVWDITMDNSATSIVIATDAKVVISYSINQIAGTTIGIVSKSTLVPSSAGDLTITVQGDAGGSAALSALAADVVLRVIVYGLSSTGN